MYDNLVKQRIMIVPKTADKRVIDSNVQLEKRLGKIFGKPAHSEDQGFVAGLQAEVVDVPEGGAENAGAVIKAVEEDPKAVLEQAKAEAESLLSKAREDAQRIREEAGQQAEAEKAGVLEQARQQGYGEGQAKARAEYDALKAELSQKEQELENQYQQMVDTLEPQFVETITGIYEHIFGVDLSSHREVLAYLISSTLRGSEGGRNFIIHVSREDYPYVSVQKRQILAGAVSSSSNVDVVEDLTLGRNECMIETDSGVFDCGLDTQLAELKTKLMLLAWEK